MIMLSYCTWLFFRLGSLEKVLGILGAEPHFVLHSRKYNITDDYHMYYRYHHHALTI